MKINPKITSRPGLITTKRITEVGALYYYHELITYEYQIPKISHFKFHSNSNIPHELQPQIQNAHGESEITAMVIDLPSKLLTGSSDGTIKIWDINTTACHRVLQAGMEGPVDILQVYFPRTKSKRFVTSQI